MKWVVCYLQRVYPRPPNSIHLLNIWVKCTCVWGKITPMKWVVFTKLYPTSKARMLLSKNLPQTSKKFTQINLPYLWHFATVSQVAVWKTQNPHSLLRLVVGVFQYDLGPPKHTLELRNFVLINVFSLHLIGPNGENWGFEGVLISFSYTFSRLFQV